MHAFQMSTLMGGQADATEDMFSKLESMRAVITEVNTQFKDPVRAVPCLDLSLTFELNLNPSRPRAHRGPINDVRHPPLRKRQRSSACAYPSSSRSTRQSGSYRS